MRVRERQEERQRVREGEQSMDAAWTDWAVYSSVIRTRVLQEWMAREDTFLQVTTHIHTKAFTLMSFFKNLFKLWPMSFGQAVGMVNILNCVCVWGSVYKCANIYVLNW